MESNRLMILLIILVGSAGASAHAEDVGTAGKNTAGDLSTESQKAFRWTKQQGRKVGGTDTKSKDAADRAQNAQDDANNKATKAANLKKENQ